MTLTIGPLGTAVAPTYPPTVPEDFFDYLWEGPGAQSSVQEIPLENAKYTRYEIEAVMRRGGAQTITDRWGFGGGPNNWTQNGAIQGMRQRRDGSIERQLGGGNNVGLGPFPIARETGTVMMRLNATIVAGWTPSFLPWMAHVTLTCDGDEWAQWAVAAPSQKFMLGGTFTHFVLQARRYAR